MKQSKIFSALLFFSFISVTNIMAQVDVKISPLNLLFGNLAGSAEVGVAPNIGIEATLGHTWNNITIDGDKYKSAKPRFGVNARYYFNPNDKGLNNFYGAVYTRYSNANLKRETDNVNGDYRRVGAGFMFGYKLVSRNEKLVFDFNVGFGRTLHNRFSLVNGESVNLNSIPLVNWDIPGTISIGYRF